MREWVTGRLGFIDEDGFFQESEGGLKDMDADPGQDYERVEVYRNDR